MVFVFDLDDTLSETDRFSRETLVKFFADNGMNVRQVNEHSRYSDGYFDWSAEEARDWFKKYGDEMAENFPVKNGADEVVRFLHERGHKIVISTARDNSWHPDPIGVTLRWLQKNDIPFDKIFTGREDKEKICEEVCADVFVDDDVSIVERVALDENKFVFLMTSDFNRSQSVPKGAIRIEKLSDILNFVKV